MNDIEAIEFRQDPVSNGYYLLAFLNQDQKKQIKISQYALEFSGWHDVEEYYRNLEQQEQKNEIS
ncbi:MAG: hypothetical protein JKP92_01135 [Alphaproteobacteria bacterium]|nr:hypothetical protein [Alphaproteobacteria bacterium]